ncbi:MAG: preprotein translocase subunit SecE [Burkholderiaceae bacterium]|jgi:preprotein translocase subunit SecE|nr:preprotein translocase subunit SecE [Burkholderiaceae bacterium]
MNAPASVETISTTADKAKLAAAALLVVGGIAAFYLLGQKDLWLRVVALLGLLAAAVVMFFISEPGKQLIAFGRDSSREVRKVVWPTRKEAMQMTGYVFAFVVVMALFLWLTDKTLEWVLYDLILGWKR